MRVTVNGEEREFSAGVTVTQALELIGIASCRGVAVELDGTFVEREAYETTTLAEGSTMEVVRFVGGG
jgi:thiamine biosynthesis protein ThiS